MENEPIPKTTWSLIEGLNGFPSNREGWGKFVDRYGAVVLRWCRERGLQAADAEDLAQDFLMRFPARLCESRYDPSRRFRDYLQASVRNALNDFQKRHGRPGATGSGETHVHDLLANHETREDLIRRLADAFDLELLEDAKAQVRERVGERVWEAYRRTTETPDKPDVVAAALGMTIGAVYQARHRVMELIGEAVRRVDSGNGA